MGEFGLARSGPRAVDGPQSAEGAAETCREACGVGGVGGMLGV